MRFCVLVSLAAVLFAVGGCGGGGAAAPRPEPRVRAPEPAPIEDPIPEPERQPLEVAAIAAREGTLLRVDVTAVGRGHQANEEFEVPGSWNIEARLHGEPLKVLLRGPVRVERGPAGERSWDVEVAFSVYFALPGAQQAARPAAALGEPAVALALTPPGEDQTRRFQMALPAPIASR